MRLGFCSLLALVAGVANAAAPPLGANEEVVQTRDGCGVVVPRDLRKEQRRHWSELTWGGACIDGLATGMGIVFAGYKPPEGPSIGPVAGWLWYGRPFGETESRWSHGAATKGFTWDHRVVSWNTLDASTATWDVEMGRSSQVSDGEVWVSAYADKLNRAPPRSVFVNHPRTQASEFVPCPAEGSCDAVWTRNAAPVIRNIKAFLKENEPKARARRAETDRLVAQWEQRSGAPEVARRADEAVRANAAAVEKKNAKEAADKACFDADTAATNDYFRGDSTPKRKTAYAAILKQIYGEQCPAHWNAESRLKAAQDLLAEVEQETQAKSAERGRFWGNLLGVVTTAAEVYQQTLTASQQPAAPVAPGISPSPERQVVQAMADAYMTRPREIEVTRLEFGGAAARTACLREAIEPGSEPPPGRQAAPFDQVVAGRGERRWLDWEMYVLVNTCDEVVAAYGAACLDATTQHGYGGGNGLPAFAAGEQVGVTGILAAGYALAKGQKLILAYRGKDPVVQQEGFTNHAMATHLSKVAWGALELNTWQAQSVGEIQTWKRSVHLALNRVAGQQPGYSLGAHQAPYPALWKGGSCDQMSMRNP